MCEKIIRTDRFKSYGYVIKIFPFNVKKDITAHYYGVG